MLSFFRLGVGLVLSAAILACGRTNLGDLDDDDSSGGAGGAGGNAGAGGMGGIGGIGGTGGVGGIGGTGGIGGIGGTGGVSSSSSSVGPGPGGGPVAYCGDGKLDADEQCDDGNDSVNDTCVFCGFASCGDGYLWLGVEGCDDGNSNESDACPSCMKAYCGDGFVQAGFEVCDDGNGSNADGCVASCKPAVCGDGFVWAGVEFCDDGNLVEGDGCSSKCFASVCGDAILNPGEQCDLGSMNADRPALLVEQFGKRTPVSPIDRFIDATVFYAYGSASSHTGYELPLASRIFFYRDTMTGELSLVFHHGADTDVTGVQQPQSQAKFAISGLPTGIVVVVADDGPGELSKTSPTTAQGSWNFQNNSDGGVLGGFPLPGNFTVDLVPGFVPGINQWAWIDGDESFVSLNLTQPIKIIAYDTPSSCRLDCTVPVCGDGILDGGEVCDDGNTASGDGCAANCSTLD